MGAAHRRLEVGRRRDLQRLAIEALGEAAKIFDTWFGPGSQEPLPRKFKIQPD